MAQKIKWNDRMYNLWYVSEEGDIFTPEVVVHVAEPWLMLTKGNELMVLIGSHWIKAKGESEVVE